MTEQDDYPLPPRNKYSMDDVYFKVMSEGESIRVFTDDGYDGWEARNIRYNQLPKNGLFAKTPSKHWVMFLKEGDKPIGVLGFASYKGFLLGSGIHVRKEYRNRGLMPLLFKKLIQEKGSKTLLASFANADAFGYYERMGFHTIQEKDIPEDIMDELSIAQANGAAGTLQKYIGSKWWFTIKGV